MIRRARSIVASCSVLALATHGARAQGSSASLTVEARTIGLVTRESHTPGDRTLTEAYLTQPIIGASLGAGWLHATGMLNLEGLTLRRGELDAGAWGEGYVDRRHPHAYLHELVVGVETRPAALAGSIYGGRGFVPFGSDDPMVRPFVSYPVDHHLAQIIERLMIVAAARAGPLAIEAATFGGDEPVDPSTLPLTRRMGDSWSLRATVVAATLPFILGRAELTASYANVKSPEYREGQGLDQRKAHVGLRYEHEGGPFTRYALVEVARTNDVDRGRDLYTFNAVLTEGALCRGDAGVALRWERSDRPEEERLLDLFRAARPATDVSILGVTLWTTITGAVSLPALRAYGMHAAPFAEVARVTTDRTTAAVFDPVRVYGSSGMWRLAAGVRVASGRVAHGRMGRYGVASDSFGGMERASPHTHPGRSRCFS
jgi:hypothetical protein